MRFLVKVNIPVEAGNSGCEGGKARHDHPIYTGGFEARGRVFHGRQWSTDGVSLPRNAGRFADPRNCGAVVPRVQCEH